MRKTTLFLSILIFIISCKKQDDNVVLTPTIDPPVITHKNIILLIGDGMGLGQISGARTIKDEHLNMLRCKNVGIQATQAADRYVTDSGASGTAMSCGEKTNHYTVGVDINENPLTSILELAEQNGLSSGLCVTSMINHATPASFYAHNPSRFDYEGIALELISSDVDFFSGGGRDFFDNRSDGLNLIDSLIARNYQVVDNLSDITGNKKTAMFYADQHPPKYSDGRGDILPNSVTAAINQLKNNEKGFFLMVEGSQIDWGADENDQGYMMDEMFDFDKAVGVALDFAEADGQTLVIITGDHETGGFALLDGSQENNTIEGAFVTIEHTGTMIPVFAYGPDSESFCGVYENTEIFYKMKGYFGF
ncbi:MAG: alkaline phosphatase [Bacteroidetes bacterium]|nr:MAG: alkaline phosphatase [Bacteroidota bacterium]